MSIYDQDLDPNPANHAALSPVSFVERSAEVFADLPAVIHGTRRYTWAHTATVTDPGHNHTVSVNEPGSPTSYTLNAGGFSIRNGTTTSSTATTGITVSNSTTGSSGTNANLPPYYALAYIMKT